MFDDEEVNDSLGTIRQCWMSVRSTICFENSPMCFRSVRWTAYTKAPRRWLQHQREGTSVEMNILARAWKRFADVMTQNKFRTPSRMQGGVPCAICGFRKVLECLVLFCRSTIVDCICSSHGFQMKSGLFCIDRIV